MLTHDILSRGRLPALYSDFRSQKTLNPDGYQANISAWRRALSRLASEGLLTRHTADASPLVVPIDNALLRQLESKQYGQPLALGTVIRDAVESKDLMPLQEFLKAPRSIYHHGWGGLPWTVLGWTLRQLGIMDPASGEEKLPTGQFVVLEKLEAAGRELGDKLAGGASVFDRVFTKNQFRSEFAQHLVPDGRLPDRDLDVLLRFLSRDKGMIEYDGQTVRVNGPGDNAGGITDQDSTIASIKELTLSLRHQVDLLNHRIDELDANAKSAVARKNRVAALAALKSRKLAESSLATRYATLNQLEEVASRIEQAADQVALVKVMESSAGVLQGLNAQTGGVEKVDSVMERLRGEMDSTDELAAIMSESTGAAVDEGQLDDELEGMMAEEKAKEDEARAERQRVREKEAEERLAAEAQRKMAELPEVPGEDELLRDKEQSPTTATGIARLTVDDRDAEEPQPMATR